MYESCEGKLPVGRRTFMQTGTMATFGLFTGVSSGAAQETGVASAAVASSAAQFPPSREKTKAKLTVVFMYPPADVVNEGQLEDFWAVNHWFTYPGNQFQPEKNHQLFKEKIDELSANLSIDLQHISAPIYTKAALAEFSQKIQQETPDAVLILNFWNTFSPWVVQLIEENAELPIIVYHPVGSNHQLPPQKLMEAKGVHYIHSVRNWDELEHGLRAVHARKTLAQSRLLRINEFKTLHRSIDKGLGVEIIGVQADEYNNLFDSIPVDPAMIERAMEFKAKAFDVMQVEDHYVVQGFRSEKAVRAIIERYQADAITIRCLMLAERKPCIGFSLCNSGLLPCACEDFPGSAITMMLGQELFGRAGFMHNPEFDINRNHYYGAHCTCALELNGPGKGEQQFRIRPFTHQLPPTAALDVQFAKGQPVCIIKYLPEKNQVSAYHGEIIDSPQMEVAGGCATRFLMKVEGLNNVCEMYQGPHPILYFGDREAARRVQVFAALYKMEFAGNV